ncbi:hypothetical protein NDU88_006435 [Pleurodeles waltl]|uniref:Uncharacterized protein n=1 Tax=Pleurodeles waltl TaxID=8319 RepID=A0AAV7VLX9_PLEWA|nr:hypothetical protein NDU88_006435 [Pleurodeles waltl]
MLKGRTPKTDSPNTVEESIFLGSVFLGPSKSRRRKCVIVGRRSTALVLSARGGRLVARSCAALGPKPEARAAVRVEPRTKAGLRGGVASCSEEEAGSASSIRLVGPTLFVRIQRPTRLEACPAPAHGACDYPPQKDTERRPPAHRRVDDETRAELRPTAYG